MLLKFAAGLFLAVTLQVGGCSLGSNGTQSVVLTTASSAASPSSSPSAMVTATATAQPPAVYFAAYNPTLATPGPYATLMTSQLDNELAASGLNDLSATYQTNATNNAIQNNGSASPPDIDTTATFVDSSLVVGFVEGVTNGFTLESRRVGTTYISTTFSATGGTWSDTNGTGATFTPYTFGVSLTAGTQYYAKWDTATTGGTTQLTLTIYTPSGTVVDQETTTDSVAASQGLSGRDYVNETADTSDSAGITSIQAYNGVQTAAAVGNPATPIPAITPAPSATQGAIYMLGQDFACGTTGRGSVAYPNDASPALNTQAAGTFVGHVPVIIVLTEVPGATSSSAYTQPACPSNWLGAQYMIRFDSYADYLAQKSIIPSWVYWVQYDNEPGVSPTTAPSELPSPNGNPNNIPAQFYGSFSQLAGTAAAQNFQASGQWPNLTSGEKTALKSTSTAYGTYGGYGWLSLYVQSQNAGATVSGWTGNWGSELTAIVGVNPNVIPFVGVGQILTGPYLGTQAQMDAVIENRPQNISGIYLSCGAVSPVPIGYAECAQALWDTAGVIVNPSPTPFPSLSPLPFPTGSPSTPVPSPTPTVTFTPTPPPPTQTPVVIVTSQPLHFGNATPMLITYTPSASTFNVGDMLVYSPSYSTSSAAFTPPPGWTEVSGCSGNTNGGIGGDVYTHVVTSGDSGTYTFGATGVTSGILYDLTGATFVTAAQTAGTASSVGAVSGATVTAGALDETLAFFAVLGGSTASNVQPRVANSPFTLPVLTSSATVNSTFSMSSGSSGSLTPSGSLGGPFSGATPTPTPNPYYTGAYVECTVVAHVSTDPTPTPTMTQSPTPPPGTAYDSRLNNNPGAGGFVGSAGFFPGWPGWTALPSSPVFVSTAANNTWNANQCYPQASGNTTPCTSGGSTSFHQMIISEDGTDQNDGSFPYTFIDSTTTPGLSLVLDCDAYSTAYYVCENYSNPSPGNGDQSLDHALVQNTNGMTESSCPSGVHGEGSTDGHILCIDQDLTIAGHHGVELGTWLAGGTHCSPTSYTPPCHDPSTSSGATWHLGAAEYCALDGDGTACDGGNATKTAGSLADPRAEDLLYCMNGGGASDAHCVLPYALRIAPGCNGPGNVYPASASDDFCWNGPYPRFGNSTGGGAAPGTYGLTYGLGVPEGTRGCINLTDAQINAAYNKAILQSGSGSWVSGGSTWESVQYRTMDCSHFGFFDLDTDYLPSGSYDLPTQGGQPYYLYSMSGSTDPWRTVASLTPGMSPSSDMYFTYSMSNPPILWCATNNANGDGGLTGLADGLCDGGGRGNP